MLNLDKITDQDRTVKWPVKIKVPQNGGKVKSHTISVEYRLPTKSALQAIVDQSDDDLSMMSALIVNAEGVQDADGNEYPYNEDLLEKLMDVEYIATGLLEGFQAAQFGGRSKN